MSDENWEQDENMCPEKASNLKNASRNFGGNIDNISKGPVNFGKIDDEKTNSINCLEKDLNRITDNFQKSNTQYNAPDVNEEDENWDNNAVSSLPTRDKNTLDNVGSNFRTNRYQPEPFSTSRENKNSYEHNKGDFGDRRSSHYTKTGDKATESADFWSNLNNSRSNQGTRPNGNYSNDRDSYNNKNWEGNEQRDYRSYNNRNDRSEFNNNNNREDRRTWSRNNNDNREGTWNEKEDLQAQPSRFDRSSQREGSYKNSKFEQNQDDNFADRYQEHARQEYFSSRSYQRQGSNFDDQSQNDQENFKGYRREPDVAEDRENRVPLYSPQAPSDNVDDMFAKNIAEGIDFDKYKNIKVHVSGGDEKQDIITSFFEKSNMFPEEIVENIKRCKYSTPTPIQKFTLPIVLKGQFDIMGCAQTGSGKTAAFLIPTFIKLIEDSVSMHESSIASPHILVILPTRELASQTWMEMRKFSYNTSIRTAVVYGGVSMNYIMSMLRRGCDALAATPGRLLQLINRNLVSVTNVKYLILDEADRMLDMGFVDVIRQIMFNYGMPDCTQRRCFMFSATFPQEIQKLAREFLDQNYYFLTVGVVGSAADSIKQEIFSVMPQEKRTNLVEVLSNIGKAKVLVFVETKRGADFLTTFLCQSDIMATSIHGDRTQEQREEALKSFMKGQTPVLVATSVAARGLDIPNVEMVLNFDLPSEIDEYVHRIGRTGRLGNKGSAVSFFTPGKDDHLSESLVKILKTANQDIPDFLKSYDYTPAQGTKNFVHSRDDRNLSKRVFKAYASNQIDQGQVSAMPQSFTDHQEEAWD